MHVLYLLEYYCLKGKLIKAVCFRAVVLEAYIGYYWLNEDSAFGVWKILKQGYMLCNYKQARRANYIK